MTRKKLYKVLDARGAPMHGGHGKWSLPRGGKPGKWMPPVRGPIKACRNGYHLCGRVDIGLWLGRDAVYVYEAEGRGDRVHDADKVAFREARLVRLVGELDARALLHFAADCAEHVLPLFETARPGDDRPWKAIRAARDYADGDIDETARAAAEAAAWAAARAAAWAAAWAAAEVATRDAERQWQARRLWRYLEASR